MAAFGGVNLCDLDFPVTGENMKKRIMGMRYGRRKICECIVDNSSGGVF